MNRKINSGSYIIVYKLYDEQEIKIGKLGKFTFPKGFYIYTGSGLRNLKQRISRHLRKEKSVKWHIDYLSMKCEPVWHYMIEDGINHECELSSKMNRLTCFSMPVKGFGSSDCKCDSHLLYTAEKRDWYKIMKQILN
jgi:sugar fermentation stimulation protein A